MPSILVELLNARQATRILIKYKTATTHAGKQYSGLLTKTDEYHLIKQKDNSVITIPNKDVLSVEDTYNDFMKNVFDKRQQGYKITANSLYGQCGGKTSSFYDKDIAASTTATGRKLLIYAKQVIEAVYKNRVCATSLWEMLEQMQIVYMEILILVSLHLIWRIYQEIKYEGKEALKITIELAQEAGALATSMLKAPHDLEYEKTFMPFALLSKKRYVGMLYEMNPEQMCPQKYGNSSKTTG